MEQVHWNTMWISPQAQRQKFRLWLADGQVLFFRRDKISAVNPPRLRTLFFRSSGLSMNPSPDSSDNNLNALAPSKSSQFHLTAVRRLPGGAAAPPCGFVKVFALIFSPKYLFSKVTNGVHFPIRSVEIRGSTHAATSVHSSLSSPFYLRWRNSYGTEEVCLSILTWCAMWKADSLQMGLTEHLKSELRRYYISDFLAFLAWGQIDFIFSLSVHLYQRVHPNFTGGLTHPKIGI